MTSRVLLAIALALALAVSGVSQEKVPRPVAQEGEVVERQVLGRPTGFVSRVRPIHQLSAGDELRTGPSTAADVLLRIPELAIGDLSAEIVESRQTESGDWLRLRWGGLVGWLRASGAAISQEGASAVLEQPDRLERRQQVGGQARAALGEHSKYSWAFKIPTASGEIEERSLRVWSDLGPKPLRRLRQLAECVPGLYADRYGALELPPPLDLEMIVFEERDAYEAFVASTTAVAGQETSGFELDGLVIVAADPHMAVNFLGTAAHELTHALNRLAFKGESLLPWVEEGMAEDIAHSVEAAFVTGRRLCRSPGAWSMTQVSDAVVMVDGRARTETRLIRSARSRSLLCYPGPEGIAELLDASRAQFASAIDRRWKYVESLILVRSLLEQALERPRELRLRLLNPQIADPGLVILKVLAGLDWRATERELLDC